MIDLLSPVLRWCSGLPGECRTIDRHRPDNPDHDPEEHSEYSRTTKQKNMRASIKNRYSNS